MKQLALRLKWGTGQRGPSKTERTGHCLQCGKLHRWKNSLGRFCSRCCKEKERSRTRDQYAEKVSRQKEKSRRLNAIKLQRGCENPNCGWQGQLFTPVMLDFDHLVPATKVRGKKSGRRKHNLSALIQSGASWTAIEEEVSKCRVLCANCHRQKTWKENV